MSVGQVKSVLLGIDGLHCSACSLSAEKLLLQLDFIKEVKMDLNKHVAEVTFKEGAGIDFAAMAAKVVDAGFSVRSLFVVYNFTNVSVADHFCFDALTMTFSFIGIKSSKVLNGPELIHLVGKDFMPGGEYKKWKLLETNSCHSVYPIDAGAKKVYQVTL